MAINSSYALWRGFNLWKEAYLDCKIFYTLPRKWNWPLCRSVHLAFSCSQHSPPLILWIEECQEPISQCLHLVWNCEVFCIFRVSCLQPPSTPDCPGTESFQSISTFIFQSISTFIFSWSLLQIWVVPFFSNFKYKQYKLVFECVSACVFKYT